MPYCTILEANKYQTYDWEKEPDFSLELSWWDYKSLLEKYPFIIDFGRYLDFYLSVTPEVFIEVANFQSSRMSQTDIPRNGINQLLDFINDIKSYREIKIMIYEYEAEN